KSQFADRHGSVRLVAQGKHSFSSVGRVSRSASSLASPSGRSGAQVRLESSQNPMDCTLMVFHHHSRESRMDFFPHQFSQPSPSNAGGNSVASDLRNPPFDRESVLAGSRASRGLH